MGLLLCIVLCGQTGDVPVKYYPSTPTYSELLSEHKYYEELAAKKEWERVRWIYRSLFGVLVVILLGNFLVYVYRFFRKLKC